MTEKSHIAIAAFVSESERLAVQAATGYLARATSEAADIPWACDSVFCANLETLQKESDAAILVTSFLPELKKISEPWSDVERDIRTAYAALSERGVPVFICTILRHVGTDCGPEVAGALLVRIRRLNLLAAEISRETGAFVIDLDRVLADIGARRLQTDYRLSGSAVAQTAGHAIALTLAENALDAFVPFEVQDAASGILASNQPAIPETGGVRKEVAMKKEIRAMGQGRRKQTVIPVVYTDRQVYAEWYLQQVMRGKIGLRELMQRLGQAVRQHGLSGSAVLIATTLSKQLQRKK